MGADLFLLFFNLNLLWLRVEWGVCLKRTQVYHPFLYIERHKKLCYIYARLCSEVDF